MKGVPIITNFKRPIYKRVTRIFLGQRSFLGIRALWQTFTYSTRKKSFFHLKTLKNFILNDKFYLKMTTIRAFFLQIRVLFSNFPKRAGETSPPPPSSYMPVSIRHLIKLTLYENDLKLLKFKRSPWYLKWIYQEKQWNG